MTEISEFDDVIDVRSVTERIEYLRDLGPLEVDDEEELGQLEELLDDLRGGGDCQWNGDWYPTALIRDSHFVRYAQEFAKSCDLTGESAQWPYDCIDWEKAARDLKVGYSSVGFNGVTYWYR